MAGAQGIKAGEGYVSIGSDLNPLDAALKRIEGKFNALGSKLNGFGKALAGVGAALALKNAVIDPLAGMVKSFADSGSVIADMSARTGAGADSLSAMGFAAEMTGSDLGTVEGAMRKLSVNLIKGDDSFKALGFDVAKLRSMSPEDQFEHVGKAIANIQDPTLRTVTAMKLLGKSGTAPLPMLESFDELKADAEQLGLVMRKTNKETGQLGDAERADGLGDAFDRVSKAIGGIGNRIISAIAEPLTRVINIGANIIGFVSKWIKNNETLAQQILFGAAAIAGIGAAIAGISVLVIGAGATFTALGAVIGGIVTVATTVFAGIGAAIGALLTPIGLVVTAIVGIGGYLLFAAARSTGAIEDLMSMFGSLGDTATTAWAGIVAAVSTGDLQTAGEIAFTALEIGWLTVTDTIQNVWTKVTGFIKDVWLNMVESIVQIGANIYFGVGKYFDLLSVTMIGAFDTAFVYIVGAIDNIQTAIAKAIIKAQEFFGLFNKEQSAEIQSTLNKDLERRAKGRQKELDQRAGGRQQGLDARDTERQKTARDFSKIVTEDFDRRRTQPASKNSSLTAAQARLADLQSKLNTQATAAQEKAAAAQDKAKQKKAEGAQSDAASRILSGEVTGSFSGAAAAQAGGVVTVAEKTNEKLDTLIEAAEKGNELIQQQIELERE